MVQYPLQSVQEITEPLKDDVVQQPSLTDYLRNTVDTDQTNYRSNQTIKEEPESVSAPGQPILCKDKQVI